MSLEAEQRIQEENYDLPYHYVVQYVNDFTSTYQFEWGINYASTIEFLLQNLQKICEETEFKSVVDIGCGDGRFTRELYRQFPNARVAGFDYSEHAIWLAKAMNSNIDIDFRSVNILQENTNEQFEIAVLMEVLEHIEIILCDKFLKGIHRLLAENALLYITVPHANVPVSSKHFRHFTVDSLSEELQEYFEILEVIPFEKQSFLKKWLMRLLFNRLFILNHKGLKNALYRYYKKHLFLVVDESECQRIYIKCRKKSI